MVSSAYSSDLGRCPRVQEFAANKQHEILKRESCPIPAANQSLRTV